MKKFIFSTVILLLFLSIQNSQAQKLDSIPPLGHEIIKKGIELNDQAKYEEAIEVFKQVNQCDPNYADACYEMALSLNNIHHLDSALDLCQKALDLDPDDIQKCILKGSLLDDLKRRDKAICWLQSCEKTYPYNQSLLYNLSICYLNNGEIEKAEKLLIKGLHYNPYHTSSHFALAKINFIMGRKAQSFLAYNMGISMNPSVGNIRSFEEAIEGQIDSISKSYLYSYPNKFDHGKLDYLTDLINSEVAFRKDFPYDYKINFLTCRESYLLFQKMQFDENDTTFYNQFYVRFFKKIFDDNQLETYLYYTIKNTNNDLVNEWINKNKGSLDNFIEKAKGLIETWKQYGFSTSNEDKHQKIYQFDSDGNLESHGKLNDTNSSKEGEWYFLSKNGSLSQKVSYRNNQLQGEALIYWPSGKVRQKLKYQGDKLNENNMTFHSNGVLSGIYPRALGVSHGEEKEYNTSGRLTSLYPFINGEINGTAIFVDLENGFVRKTPYLKNKREGTSNETWLNSYQKTETLYVDSLLNGGSKKWFANGKQEWEGSYINDIQVGKWVSYYADGTKSAEGTCDQAGNLTGVYTEFDHSGNKKVEISGYTNGKEDGTETFYFPDGKVQAKFLMKEGKITRVECFDLSGKIIYSENKTNGMLNYKYFFPNGKIKLEGQYLDGLRAGLWKGYNPIGRVASEENWTGGQRSGIQKYYYENGNTKLIYNCDSDKIFGKVIRYYMNGHTSFVGYYDAQGSTGEWTNYFGNDSVESRTFFVNNQLSGRRFNYTPEGHLESEETFDTNGKLARIKTFDYSGKLINDLEYPEDSTTLSLQFPNGKLKAKFSICDRKNNGTQEYYFPNGQLKSKQSFIYGNLQGSSLQWDHHGNPVEVRNYMMNKLDGKLEVYENGKLAFIDNYQMDSNNGLFKEFHDDGHIFRTIWFDEGERQGVSDAYAPDSTWMYSLQYIDDVLCTISYLDNQGIMHVKEDISNIKKEVVCYFKNGKVSARLPLANGIFNGKFDIYYSNGQLLRELSYMNDYREGTSKYYFANGTLKETTEWKNGQKHGPSTIYNSNGKKKLEGSYLANKKNGKWQVYNEAGNLVETLSYSNDDLYEINE